MFFNVETNWKVATLHYILVGKWYGVIMNDGIITSLQILKDEATREKYDYAIAHPEEVFRFFIVHKFGILLNRALLIMFIDWSRIELSFYFYIFFYFYYLRCFTILHNTIERTMVTRRWDLLCFYCWPLIYFGCSWLEMLIEWMVFTFYPWIWLVSTLTC